MLSLIINLWLISFIFLGSIIACLDDIKKELKDINIRLIRSVDNISSTNKSCCASTRDGIDKLIHFFEGLTRRSR